MADHDRLVLTDDDTTQAGNALQSVLWRWWNDGGDSWMRLHHNPDPAFDDVC